MRAKQTHPESQSMSELFPLPSFPEDSQIEILPPEQTQTHKSFWRIFLNNFAGFSGFMYSGYLLVYVSCVPMWMQMQQYKINLSETDATTLLSAIIPVGGMFGAFLSIYFIQVLSRKHYMFLISLVAAIGLGLIQIPNFPCLVIGKFIQGITVGAECAISPLFVSELSPKALKGIMGNINQSFLGFGVIIAQLLSYSINSNVTEIQQIYRLVFAFPLVFILIRVVIFSIYTNETPTYLVIAGKDEQAKQLIRQLYEQLHVDKVLMEVEQQVIKSTNVQAEETPQNKTNKVRIFIGVLINLNQQFSGINVVAVFGGQICGVAVPGYGVLLMIFVMLCQMLGAYTSMFIIKKVGRRALLHFGTIISFCTNVALATAFLPVFSTRGLDDSIIYSKGQTIPIIIFMFIYIFIYGMTLGPITFSYIPQICSAKYLSIPVASNWIAGIITIVIFPIVSRYISIAYVFYILAGLCLVGEILNVVYLVEVEGKSEQEIEEQLEKLKFC